MSLAAGLHTQMLRPSYFSEADFPYLFPVKPSSRTKSCSGPALNC